VFCDFIGVFVTHHSCSCHGPCLCLVWICCPSLIYLSRVICTNPCTVLYIRTPDVSCYHHLAVLRLPEELVLSTPLLRNLGAVKPSQHKKSPWLSGRQCIPWRHLQAIFIRDGDVVSISSSCTVLYLAMYSMLMWVRELLVSWVYQISFAFSSRPKLYVIIFNSKIGRPAEEM